MPGLTFYCFRVPNLLTLCSFGVLFFASFHVGQEKRIVMQLFAFALSSLFMLVAKSQPAFPPGIGDVMRQLAASMCVHFWIQWSRHFLQRHE